ncbi:uncharacterized protein LOC129599154 [Paramacrobiotus metropolitanus]|uniref:uncharacterized protein LOC129599154 n=1 Tax=Paramacrobiotus metropolitanus TaxID=2943436 RepID=UPI002445F14D|nr:uncharacterized protein LOC129599154 [Paramacrobiotus metropolitanus]
MSDARKRSASSVRANKTPKVRAVTPCLDDDDDAVLPASVFSVTTVVAAKSSPEHEFSRLDDMFSKPVLSEVFSGTRGDAFPVLATNKRVKDNEWTLLIRDKFQATSEITFPKKLNKFLQGLATPSVVSIERFNVTERGIIVVDDINFVKFDCNLREHVTAKWPMPEVITAKNSCNLKTSKIDIFDLGEKMERAELH